MRKKNKVIKKTSDIGTKDGETRATFIINEKDLTYVKAIAYWERKNIKDILAEALQDYLFKKKDIVIEATINYQTKKDHILDD